MRKRIKLKNLFFLTLTILSVNFQSCKKTAAASEEKTDDQIQESTVNNDSFKNVTGKQIYFPSYIWDGANGKYINQTRADYDNTSSRFCTARSVVTKNFIIFWEAGFGNDPSTAPAGYRVSMNEVKATLESMYAFYRDNLKFVDKGSSLTDTYRMVVYLFYNKDFGTVYGSGADDKVGVMLLYPQRLSGSPYGALAHELGHAFQYMVHSDGKIGFTDGTHWEMTSQYMLWRYYLNWPIFESYHVDAFMNKTNLAFTHEDNQYHSPFVLEYWASQRGESFIGSLWKSAQSGEDFVMTYKRITGLSQEAFNSELFNGYRKFITWDIDRDRSTMADFSNKHITKLNNIGNGWFQIATDYAPQNYGYNAIKLNVTAANTTVTANFKGLSSAASYNVINSDKAGWRYGFVALKSDGTRTYGEVYIAADGSASFTVPSNTTNLWFVVMGAPTQHWKHTIDFNNSNDEQWPYQVKFNQTSPSSGFVN